MPDDSPWSEEKRQRYRTRKAKQNAMLRAAASEFSKRGFSGVSLDDIAARIGVSKPTIYYHLGDKDAVFAACHAAALESLFALRDALKTEPRPASQALREFVKCYVQIVTGPYGYCLVMTDPVMLSPADQAKVKERGEEVKAMLMAILRQGVKERIYKAGHLEAASSIIAGALNWIVRWYDPDRHQPSKIVDRFHKSFEALLQI